jgi:Mn2+/Fe2+ NRAMP family transporter
MNVIRNLGPGTLIAAAFVGPGTVTVCTVAGVRFGFTLLWAMLLSVVATLILQEMTVRLGLVHGKGLAATVKEQLPGPTAKILGVALMLSAIVIGNAAYQAGNISGAALGVGGIAPGLEDGFRGWPLNPVAVLMGAVAFTLLFIGQYRVIERALMGIVVLMSVSFFVSALLTRPDLGTLLTGVFVPRVPEEGFLTIVALVGTTVVPYNLFLHPALVQEKWKGAADLGAARLDSLVAIGLGGFVSMAIIVSAAAVQGAPVESAADLARGLQPLFGQAATVLLSAGLFAAGISSAITAPLAAAYVARDCFGWEAGLRTFRFRAVWMGILVLGVGVASLGYRPVELITFAQVANGILLPILAGFLLWVMNAGNLLGEYRNRLGHNVAGGVIVLLTLVLSARSLDRVFDWGLF